MHSAADIRPAVIRRYVREAIDNVDAGRQIEADRNKALELPAELRRALRQSKGATAAFRTLTPGRQREYADYVGSAKREDTRQKRIDKILPMILAGAGLNDRYR